MTSRSRIEALDIRTPVYLVYNTIMNLRTQRQQALSLDGEVTLAELEDDHEIVIANSEVTTIAGLVLSATSTLPSPGTTVTVESYELTVEEMRGRKITRVRIRPT